MRCVHCGMPLSPSHTHCARCGTAVTAGAQGSAQKQAPEGAYGPGGANVGVALNQQAWGQQTPATPWNIQQTPLAAQVPPSPYQQGNSTLPQQLPFPQAAPSSGSLASDATIPWQSPQQPMQAWPSAPATMNSPLQAPGPRLSSQPYYSQAAAIQGRPQPFVRPPQNAGKRRGSQGFIIAALCVLTGGLLLAFVYIISLGLPPTSPAVTSQNKAQATAVTNNATPTASPGTTTASPTPVNSPTPTYPGQQYLDNAQMASQVNIKSALPVVQTTNFRVGQQIFVTFALHPGGRPGAVCLLWYLNSKQFTHFEFSVSGVSSPAYSYTYAGTAGTAYVELYWASSTACTDKMLAQRVDFMVSA